MACLDENFLPRIFFSRIFPTMNFYQTTVYIYIYIAVNLYRRKINDDTHGAADMVEGIKENNGESTTTITHIEH